MYCFLLTLTCCDKAMWKCRWLNSSKQVTGKKRICKTTNIKIDKQITYSNIVKAFSITKRLIQTSWILELLLRIVRLERTGKLSWVSSESARERKLMMFEKVWFFFWTETVSVIQWAQDCIKNDKLWWQIKFDLLFKL